MNFLRHYIAIGNPLLDANSHNIIGIVKRVGTGWQGGAALLFGSVENQGTLAMTFYVEQSDDNAISDAYAAVNFRVGGASVSSLVIPPGGCADFLLEYNAQYAHGLFVKFSCSVVTGVPQGMLGLAYRESANVEYIVPNYKVGA